MSQLWPSDDVRAWAIHLSSYPTVLAQYKPSTELCALDANFMQMLHTTNKQFITKAELEKIVKWKLTRGKMRPAIPNLIRENSEQTVVTVSDEAFAMARSIKGDGAEYQEQQKAAIKHLSLLRGVGPATASAILAFIVDSHFFAFAADEALAVVLPRGTKPKYSLNEYITFVGQMMQKAEELNEKAKQTGIQSIEWSAQDISQCLWCEAHRTLAPVLPSGSKKRKLIAEDPKRVSRSEMSSPEEVPNVWTRSGRVKRVRVEQ